LARWLLNTFPTWLLGAMFMGGLALLALAGAIAVRRWLPKVAAGEYRETGTILLAQSLALYSLVLAFVIVNEYGDVNQSRNDVQSEALNVEDLYRSSLSLDEPARSRMTAVVRDYVRTVANEEWDLLRDGKWSPRVNADLDRMFVIFRRYEPKDATQNAFYKEGIGYLHTTHEARHRRVDQAMDSLPGALAAFIVLGALANIGAAYLVGLGVLLGFTLFLALTLEHPFSGSDAITNFHFKEGTLAQFFR
jgi:hypothetical protein